MEVESHCDGPYQHAENNDPRKQASYAFKFRSSRIWRWRLLLRRHLGFGLASTDVIRDGALVGILRERLPQWINSDAPMAAAASVVTLSAAASAMPTGGAAAATAATAVPTATATTAMPAAAATTAMPAAAASTAMPAAAAAAAMRSLPHFRRIRRRCAASRSAEKSGRNSVGAELAFFFGADERQSQKF